MNSNLWSLNQADFWKGLIVAVLTAVLTAVYEYVSKGSTAINWKTIGMIGATAGIAYFLKNFATGSGGKLLTNDPNLPPK